jgi:transcriptional regulator with XRE-family HTH domain
MNDIPQIRFFIAARKALGWSQAELAKRSNVAVSTIADWERGKRRLVRNNFNAVCKTFGQAGIEFLIDDEKIIGLRWPE